MSSSSVVHADSIPRMLVALVCLAGCARAQRPTVDAPADPVAEHEVETNSRHAPATTDDDTDPVSWLASAEQALQAEQPARAAALFARYLAHDPSGDAARQAYPGLARAHQQLGDFEAAIRAYDGFLRHFPDDADVPTMLGRRGACEAEIGEWERSAATFAAMLERGGDRLLAPDRVEALARQGFALFQIERYEEADARLAEADEVHRVATETESKRERFGDTYFVAMARFYRAAIIHLRFRAAPIRLPEAQMNADFEAKLALLEQAQDAYNRTIQARHVFWVSAAGYQLGSLFEEFYDAMMYAPTPEWLDDHQREIYYQRLEEQLRPVVDKAVWVFEKNLETARKLGYDNEFVELSERQLERLQTVLLGRDARLGQPVPRLASDPREDGGQDWTSDVEVPAVERKLFVPLPTPL